MVAGILLISLTPVTDPCGWEPGQKCLCSSAHEHLTLCTRSGDPPSVTPRQSPDKIVYVCVPFSFLKALLWAIPPVRLGLSGRNSGKFRKRSQSISWNSPLGCPKLSPPPVRLGRLSFQNWFQRGPLRAGHGIPSSTEGIPEALMTQGSNNNNTYLAQSSSTVTTCQLHVTHNRRCANGVEHKWGRIETFWTRTSKGGGESIQSASPPPPQFCLAKLKPKPHSKDSHTHAHTPKQKKLGIAAEIDIEVPFQPCQGTPRASENI